ncbi:MAG: hypothetical protein IKE66_13120 [Hyphomicrobium sp.]|nr:hypothetical protein [Hyphomicrobium sp.]
MKKSILAAAAFAALAIGSASGASAGVIGGNLGGVKASAPVELAQQVHWRPYKHKHNRWNKYRKGKQCAWRNGKRRCGWR